MSTSNKCAGCKNSIKTKELLSCSICALKYDLLCANISEKQFNTMGKEHKRIWKCPECYNKQPKKDNTNTPIRSGTRHASPTSEHSDNFATTFEPTGSGNVTLRASQRQMQSGITLDNIRDVIKEEMMAIVKAQVTQELKAIKQQMSDYHEAVTFINNQYEDLKASIEEKSCIISKLQLDNESLSSTVNDLSSRLNLSEQLMRENNLEINGLPEHRSENLVSTVIQLAKVVDNPLGEEDVINVTRVAKLNKDSGKPRAIIVKLRSPRQRDNVLAAVIKFNKNNSMDKLSSQHLGLGGTRVPIFIAEHLTPTNKALHAATRKKAKEFDFKFVWVRNGRIFARKNESCQAHLIRNLDSLKLIS